MSLRRRTSIREIFRSKSRSNLVEANLAPSDAPAPQTAYVPVNAASGFSQTFKSPRSFQFQTSLPTTREETATATDYLSSSSRKHTDGDIDGKDAAEHALRRERISRQLIRPGHLYIDLPPEDAEPEAQPGSARAADDFRAFVAAAKAHEEARLYFTNPQETAPPHSPSQPKSPSYLSPISRQRDSGYSSASLSPLRDVGTPLAPGQTPPQQRGVDGQGQGREKTLRKRQSLRLVGQRIAEYVRPMDGGPLSASHAAVR